MNLLVTLLLALVTRGGTTLSYRSLTRPEASAAFYRSAGHGWSDQRVHLHVASTRILGKPSRIARNAIGGKLYVFENQSVPLVVDPSSVYFRKILDRVGKGERVCVMGQVKPEPKGGKDRLALWVHKVKRAHDETRTTETGAKGKKPKKAKASGKKASIGKS